MAQITVIPRQIAKDFLNKRVRTRTAFGKIIKTSRHRRGAGAAVDIINYGYVVKKKPRIVMRIGPAPFGNQPVISAVGKQLAPKCAYIMRLCGQGVSHDELLQFVEQCVLRFHTDMLKRERDFRYLLSLDEPKGWLIEGESVFEAPAYAGRIYQAAGAFSAGFSKSRPQPTRWVDKEGVVRSIYQSGRNILKSLPEGARLVKNSPMHRYVFVCAKKGSLEYSAWRRALPPHVRELHENNNLNVVQPRLLVVPHATT